MQQLFKYCGAIGILVLWGSVGAALLITSFNVLGRLPISYLGVYESSRMLFNSGLIIASVMLVLFSFYLQRRFKTNALFNIAFLIGQLCQIVVALTPYNATSAIKLVHVVAAFILAFMLPLTMYLFRYAKNIEIPILRLTRRFLWLEILLFILGIGWFVLASRAGALAEIITALTFDTWILWLSLNSRKAAPEINV